MSRDPKWQKAGKNAWVALGDDITDTQELARLSAQRPPDDGGASLIVGQAVMVMDDRTRRGKPATLVPAILEMLELLTPEQQLDLAAHLPEKLSAEAMAKLAEAARPAPDGVNGEG
jgi:hypothetical protein